MNDENPDVEGVASRLWVATIDAASYAAVDRDEKSDDRFTVWQHGPRRDRPAPERFGPTVTTTVWSARLDKPDQDVPWPG
ncbi:hypothetical protein ACWFR1_35675 [Streptomyces sp. NPDC055103]